jgi:hypothetical protein
MLSKFDKEYEAREVEKYYEMPNRSGENMNLIHFHPNDLALIMQGRIPQDVNFSDEHIWYENSKRYYDFFDAKIYKNRITNDVRIFYSVEGIDSPLTGFVQFTAQSGQYKFMLAMGDLDYVGLKKAYLFLKSELHLYRLNQSFKVTVFHEKPLQKINFKDDSAIPREVIEEIYSRKDNLIAANVTETGEIYALRKEIFGYEWWWD